MKQSREFDMRYILTCIPPGGGEADYEVTIDNATVLPRVGEYIILRAKEETGVRAFRVLFVTSNAVCVGDGQYQAEPAVVQAEFIRHPHQSEAHGRSVAMYEARGKQIDEDPASGY